MQTLLLLQRENLSCLSPWTLWIIACDPWREAYTTKHLVTNQPSLSRGGWLTGH